MLIPKLVTCMKTYDKEQFIKDVISGIIVAVIALPLAIALAIASGVSPEKGLLTAIIGGFFVSLLGGSRVQIGGPTGAFVIIVYGIIAKYGMDGLMISTILAGIFLILMGVFKMGALIKYIPSPIITGFTSGIAVVIFSTQIKDFLGLEITEIPSEFIAKWASYINNFDTLNLQSLIIGTITIMIILFWPKFSKKIPGTFIAIIASTLITISFNLNIETIGTQFNDLAFSIPKISFPNISLSLLGELMLPAFTIAILASVESLLSAVVADGMIGGKHRSNMELVAQGVANIASSLFGGIPVTGAIARTAANVKNGGRTPIAGIIHSIVLLLIMFLFIPYVKLIPMSALAAVLIIVAYNMGEWEAFKRITKAPKSDVLVFLMTFALTIFIDLVAAIGVGVVLSSFLFMRRMAEITDVRYIIEDMEDSDIGEILSNVISPEYVTFYEINGPFFFGAANKFASVIREISIPSKILILKMTNVPVIDSTAYHSLEMLFDICKKHNTGLIILQLQDQPKKMLEKYGFVKMLGDKNFCNNTDSAIERANELIAAHQIS